MNQLTSLKKIEQFIEFDFYPVNHSVVRAEYKYPCIPYEATEASKKGFFSGFYPVDAVLDSVSVSSPHPTCFHPLYQRLYHCFLPFHQEVRWKA